MKNTTETSALSLLANDAGYDPLEDRLRENIRSTIEAVFEEELAQFLGRCRYGREDALRQGYRNGHRERQLTGTFGTERVSVPRARIVEEDGRASEWRSRALPRYQRLTRKAEALIASVYLSGTNTRRVKRALFGLFRGAVSKDVVSRAWRKVKVDWDAWCSRGLADEDIVRLILDGTVIKTRLDRKATNISVLAAIGVRRDGQKVLLSIGNMGGESQAAWRQFLDDLDARGLKRPGFVIVDGAPGLEAALSALWGDDLPVQRCTVHKHRNLLGHAPKHMHDELSEDYRDMIYADTASGRNPELWISFLLGIFVWHVPSFRGCSPGEGRPAGEALLDVPGDRRSAIFGVYEQAHRSVTPILNAEVGAVEARADDDLVALGPHPLDGAQGDDLAGSLAPALLRGPFAVPGEDLAVGLRLEPLNHVAVVIEARAE